MISCCKMPMHFFAEQALGSCMPIEPKKSSQLENIAQTVYTVVVTVIFALGACLSIPLWSVGEACEVIYLGNVPFEDNNPDISATVSIDENDPDLKLNPQTKYMGFSCSTYQNTSNPDGTPFCENSDWRKYIKEHFKSDPELLPGKGVDFLTPDGRVLLADKILESGGNTIRFSVEWADVLGDDGKINPYKLGRYVEVAKYFYDRKITPIVTLHHFVTPLDSNGKSLFENQESVEQFAEYAGAVYKALHDYVDHFVTFNEPAVVTTMNYILGDFPAGNKGSFWKYERVQRHLENAHIAAYDKFHELAKARGKDVHVGLTHQALKLGARSRWNIPARIASFVMTYFFHERSMQWVEKNQEKFDWFGIQYYTRPLIGGFPEIKSICREGETMIESMDFRFDPCGIYERIIEIDQCFQGKVPLMVTETGIAGKSNVIEANEMDQRRANYMSCVTKSISKAQKEVPKLIGVLFWSLFDNFEWNHGRSKDHGFGVVAFDPDTDKMRDTHGMVKITAAFKRTEAEKALSA